MENKSLYPNSLNKKSKILFFIILFFFAVSIIGSIVYKNSLTKPYEPGHQNNVLSWEFKGIVKNIQSPGHDIVWVTINDKQYQLYDYKTWVNHSTDLHEVDTTSEFSYYSHIEKGDSLIKNKGQLEIRLIKHNDGKQFILHCTTYQ